MCKKCVRKYSIVWRMFQNPDSTTISRDYCFVLNKALQCWSYLLSKRISKLYPTLHRLEYFHEQLLGKLRLIFFFEGLSKINFTRTENLDTRYCCIANNLSFLKTSLNSDGETLLESFEMTFLASNYKNGAQNFVAKCNRPIFLLLIQLFS